MYIDIGIFAWQKLSNHSQHAILVCVWIFNQTFCSSVVHAIRKLLKSLYKQISSTILSYEKYSILIKSCDNPDWCNKSEKYNILQWFDSNHYSHCACFPLLQYRVLYHPRIDKYNTWNQLFPKIHHKQQS